MRVKEMGARLVSALEVSSGLMGWRLGGVDEEWAYLYPPRAEGEQRDGFVLLAHTRWEVRRFDGERAQVGARALVKARRGSGDDWEALDKLRDAILKAWGGRGGDGGGELDRGTGGLTLG